MSFTKRQIGMKPAQRGTLDKTAACSRTELERADYLMRYGKDWLQQWWIDHPGACCRYDEEPEAQNVVFREDCPADRAYARGQADYPDDVNPYTWNPLCAYYWDSGNDDAKDGLFRLRPVLGLDD